MKKPLTEKEKEILDFYDSHSCMETMKQFDVAKWKVHSLRYRQKRLEEEKEEGKACFIEIPMEETEDRNDSVSFAIGKRMFTMSVHDFRRAFIDD